MGKNREIIHKFVVQLSQNSKHPSSQPKTVNSKPTIVNSKLITDNSK